ncbi:von Willebrand factor A domain-containing protein 5B1-like [Polyodon spathula]|uniref:von Willebrand factor A domain-containing protein 5B1-like n=1 Tax=Polyodon spathula TaxID=7913 RepID=UPI001B7EB6A8|nr:von Willebrand factor A domain-containing protein 5B1-like [Polyodon spathula]
MPNAFPRLHSPAVGSLSCWVRMPGLLNCSSWAPLLLKASCVKSCANGYFLGLNAQLTYTNPDSEPMEGLESPTHALRADGDPSAKSASATYITLAEEHPYNCNLEIILHLSEPHTPHVLLEEGRLTFQEYEQHIRARRDFIHCSRKEAESDKRLEFVRKRFHKDILLNPVLMLNFCPDLRGAPGDLHRVTRELVFLVDRSGSMSGANIHKIKEAMIVAIKSLPPGTLLNIVGFGSTIKTLFSTSRVCSEDTLSLACEYLQKMRADMGSTNILGALSWVFQQPVHRGYPRQLFILTDGKASNAGKVIELVRRHASTARCFSVGLGPHTCPRLLRGVSRVTGGTAEFLSDSERVEPKLIKSLKKALEPALSDVRIDWYVPDNVEALLSPNEIAPLYPGDRLIGYCTVYDVSAFQSKKAGSKARGSKEQAQGSVRSVSQDDLPAPSAGEGCRPSERSDIEEALCEISHEISSEFSCASMADTGVRFGPRRSSRPGSRRQRVYSVGLGRRPSNRDSEELDDAFAPTERDDTPASPCSMTSCDSSLGGSCYPDSPSAMSVRSQPLLDSKSVESFFGSRFRGFSSSGKPPPLKPQCVSAEMEESPKTETTDYLSLVHLQLASGAFLLNNLFSEQVQIPLERLKRASPFSSHRSSLSPTSRCTSPRAAAGSTPKPTLSQQEPGSLKTNNPKTTGGPFTEGGAIALLDPALTSVPDFNGALQQADSGRGSETDVFEGSLVQSEAGVAPFDLSSEQQAERDLVSSSWATAVALAWLEHRRAGFFVEWELVAAKADSWLRAQQLPEGMDQAGLKGAACQKRTLSPRTGVPFGSGSSLTLNRGLNESTAAMQLKRTLSPRTGVPFGSGSSLTLNRGLNESTAAMQLKRTL